MTEDWLFVSELNVLFTALVLSGARPLSFIFILPLYTRFGLQQGLIQGAIMVSMAAPVIPGLAAEIQTVGVLPIPVLAGLIVKELLLGVLLGLILGVPLWAVATAGDFIDMQRGASMANLVEPGSGNETTVTGTLLFLLTAVILIAAGWFIEVVLDSLYESYKIWPILKPLPPLNPAAAAGALKLLDKLMETGLIISIPIIGPLLLGELALSLAGKYTQQLNIMFLSMSLKQVIYILVMPIYFSSLVYYAHGELRELAGTKAVIELFFNYDEEIKQ